MINNLYSEITLDKLFSAFSSDSYKEKFQEAIKKSNTSKDIIIFGAGTLGAKVAELLKISGLNVVGFCDNATSLAGGYKIGIPVYSPDMLAKNFPKDILVIVAIWSYRHSFPQTKFQLEKLGFTNIIHSLIPLVVFQKNKDYLPNYCLDTPEKIIQSKDQVIAAYKIIKQMGDPLSLSAFEKIIAFYLNPVADNIPLPIERRVFQELPDEVYVDCGAFIGETVHDFIQSRGGIYGSIYCFEPDQISFNSLRKNLQRYIDNQLGVINLVNAAVGDSSKKVSFSHTGTWGSKVEGVDNLDMVNQYALDNYTWTMLPTLIKFDIEGQELSALEGANSFIKNAETVLSITAEHRIEDLWEIPLHLYAANPDRLIYLVPQDCEIGMDLVYYSVPQQRAVTV